METFLSLQCTFQDAPENTALLYLDTSFLIISVLPSCLIHPQQKHKRNRFLMRRVAVQL
jgi:hypothetical protein